MNRFIIVNYLLSYHKSINFIYIEYTLMYNIYVYPEMQYYMPVINSLKTLNPTYSCFKLTAT